MNEYIYLYIFLLNIFLLILCLFQCQQSLSNVFVYCLTALAQPASSCPWLAGNRGHVADQVSFQGLVAGT